MWKTISHPVCTKKKYETKSQKKDKLHAQNPKCREIMIQAWLSLTASIKGNCDSKGEKRYHTAINQSH